MQTLFSLSSITIIIKIIILINFIEYFSYKLESYIHVVKLTITKCKLLQTSNTAICSICTIFTNFEMVRFL